MGIAAVFKYEEDVVAAAKNLRAAGFEDISLMSPIPMHAAEEAVGLHKSNVRRFALFGAIVGALGGFAMCVATALVFIMPTGGRAVIALPPYFLITYESTILIGVLSTLIGFFLVSRLPAWRNRPYRPEANVDRFVVVVEDAEGEKTAQVEQIIREAGAEEIQKMEDGE